MAREGKAASGMKAAPVAIDGGNLRPVALEVVT
jgi:hypothetical protein